MAEAKRLSTTQLAKTRGLSQTQLFSDLSDNGLIKKENDKWILTEAGEQLGGVHLTSKYGQYVAWPEDVVFEKSVVKIVEAAKITLITATAIGKHFDLSSKR